MALFQIASSLLAVFLVTAVVALARLRQILDPKRPKPSRKRGEKTHLLIVLGSGGHTAEMLAMLERAVKEDDVPRRLEWEDYSFRTWVVGTGDSISAERAREFEVMVAELQGRREQDGSAGDADATGYRIVTVPRAREIHQPLLTAPVSCLGCMFACISALLPSGNVDFPDLILTSGPASATILVFTSILLRFFNVKDCNGRGKMRTIYVESWARVKRLSLSGRMLVWVVDRFFVQWEGLVEAMHGRGEYLGVLV